jgi:hypothetical protein
MITKQQNQQKHIIHHSRTKVVGMLVYQINIGGVRDQHSCIMHVSNLLVLNGLVIYKILKNIEVFEQSFG